MNDDVESVCDEHFPFGGDTAAIAEDAKGCHGCAYILGAAVAFGLMGMAEAIRERTWNCIMCEGDTDGDTCEWCQAPRGIRCPACEVGPCEDHVRSAGDRRPASDKST